MCRYSYLWGIIHVCSISYMNKIIWFGYFTLCLTLEDFEKCQKDHLLLIADFFNISVPWPASKKVIKATLYEALVEQQILPEREVLSGVATRPPQAPRAAGADT